MSSSNPRILFQTFNRRGLGHFMRGHNIARQISQRQPHARIRFYVRSDVPEEMKSAAFEYFAESDPAGVSHWPECVDEFRPEVVVYDTMLPANFEQELSLSNAARVYVMRKCKRARQQELFEHPFLRKVDLILVPHSRNEFEFEVPDALVDKTIFVGPIVRKADPVVVQQLRRKYEIADNSFVLVSSPGGGGFQEEAKIFFEIVSDVHSQLLAREIDIRHMVVTGPKYEGELEGQANMIVVKSEPEMASLIALADLTISAGGYNTVNEIRVTKSPAVFLPSPRTHDDQTGRVRKFEDLGRAIVLSGLSCGQTVERIVRLCMDPIELSRMRQRYQTDHLEIGNSRAADRILELGCVLQPLPSGCDATRFISGGCTSLADFWQMRGDEDVRCTGRILDHSPDERMVVEFETTFTGRQNSFCIGKFYGGDQAELGQNSYDTMGKLQNALAETAESGHVLRIPAAVYYDRGIQCLFQQKASGVPLTDVIGTDKLYFALKQAGIALSQLHSLDFEEMTPKSLADHVSELIRPHPTVLSQHFPAYRQTIADCLELLQQSDANWPSDLPIVPIHRDFQLRQLFLDSHDVWLVDWDLFAYGDPAFDVGYFVAYLKTHLPLHDFAGARAAFLGGYLKNGSAAVQERLPVYLAFNFLRRACRRFRIRDESWQSEIHRMMELIESVV